MLYCVVVWINTTELYERIDLDDKNIDVTHNNRHTGNMDKAHIDKAMENKSIRIKNLRKYLNLTLASFGNALGCSGTQVQRFEQNKTEPSERLIQKICEIYEVDRGYFTGMMELEDAVSENQIFDKDKNRKEVGARLRLARTEKGLSMLALSKISGVPDSHISNIENGKDSLLRRTAARLGEALEVGVDWILYDDEDRKGWPVNISRYEGYRYAFEIHQYT